MNRVTRQDVSSKLASVDRFFATEVSAFTRRLRELESRIDPWAVPERLDDDHLRMQELFQESQDSCRRFEEEHGEDPVLLRDVQRGFRQETAPWFDRSWIAHRARSKPSGFAGDFEMLERLYEESTPALGVGGYLDLCILDLPLARAVRARLAAARSFLIDEVAGRTGATRILDVACGPCREYLDWPAISGQRSLEVVAMDNDPRVLEHVNARVVGRLPAAIHLNPVRYNALRTRSADATTRRFGRFDIIYSVGLFDYLSDEQLIPMLGALRDCLRDDGVLYIAFKDRERYDKTPYQWHLDWFFFQRNVSDCLRLYEQAGFAMESLRMTRDATGIIVNFRSQQPAPGYIRTDLAENVIAPLGITGPLGTPGAMIGNLDDHEVG